MFTFRTDNDMRSGDIVNGRLVEVVRIHKLSEIIGATWALFSVLSLLYGVNILCWLTGFSIYENILTLSIDMKHQNEDLSLWRWGVVLLSPFGHFSRFHFTIEIILLAFIFLHNSNVLGQFTTLIVTIVTPYFAVFSLLVLEEPSLAVGTISASAALLTIAIIANARQILTLSWVAQAIALGFGLVYFAFAPLGAIISAMSGIAIGVLVSYLSNINVGTSEVRLSQPLLAITYYQVPPRFALLAYPITIVLLLWGILFGAN